MTLCGELALEEDRLPNGDDVGRPELAHHLDL
jgi:hypothetical protein